MMVMLNILTASTSMSVYWFLYFTVFYEMLLLEETESII